MALKDVAELSQRIAGQVRKAVLGKDRAIELSLAVVLAEGHALLQDVPGVAKTHLVKNMARAIGLEFRRVQATPDLLPSDIVGTSIFDPRTTEFRYRPGPVFTNLLLVDELNRATPRTQSGLLECMAERQVSNELDTRPLPRPFCVFATQNPVDYEGTFPLPEAQLDRFAVCFQLGYPDEPDELRLLEMVRGGASLQDVSPVADAAELTAAQQACRGVHVAEAVMRYLLNLIRATRTHPDILLGASPRASIDLLRLAQTLSAMRGEGHVLPETVRYLVPFVLGHRIKVKPEARMQGRTPSHLVAGILERIPAPGL